MEQILTYWPFALAMLGTGVVSGLGIAFLQKPFAPDDLLRLVDELLDSAQEATR